tara:strand:+ start:12934 stop:13746 length:813 start_codon:yes stop_codon:yes gene_type:complete
MNNNDIDKALEIYYSLKNKYDEKLFDKKRKIIKNTSLSKKKKKQLISNLMPGCINCNQKGKTLFTQKDNILIAQCQASKSDGSKGCNLDIQIDRGDVEQIFVLNKFMNEEVNDYREKIIKTKLDLLFGYIDESNALTRFTEEKQELQETQSEKNNLLIEFNKIVENKDNKKEIEELKVDIFVLIEGIKKNLEENNIFDAIDIYINQLMSQLKDLRNKKYVKNEILCNDGLTPNSKCGKETDGKYYLIQEPFNLKTTEIELKAPKVIKLDK